MLTIFENNNNNKSDKIHRKSFVNHVKHGRTSYIMHYLKIRLLYAI